MHHCHRHHPDDHIEGDRDDHHAERHRGLDHGTPSAQVGHAKVRLSDLCGQEGHGPGEHDHEDRESAEEHHHALVGLIELECLPNNLARLGRCLHDEPITELLESEAIVERVDCLEHERLTPLGDPTGRHRLAQLALRVLHGRPRDLHRLGRCELEIEHRLGGGRGVGEHIAGLSRRVEEQIEAVAIELMLKDDEGVPRRLLLLRSEKTELRTEPFESGHQIGERRPGRVARLAPREQKGALARELVDNLLEPQDGLRRHLLLSAAAGDLDVMHLHAMMEATNGNQW